MGNRLCRTKSHIMLKVVLENGCVLMPSVAALGKLLFAVPFFQCDSIEELLS